MAGIDLGFIGYMFTWVNRYLDHILIKERLDRAIVFGFAQFQIKELKEELRRYLDDIKQSRRIE